MEWLNLKWFYYAAAKKRELELDFLDYSIKILVDFKLISKTLPDVKV